MRLAEQGIETGVHYAPAAHRHAAWEGVLPPLRADAPEAEAWAREELSLPMFAELEASEVERVVAACIELGDGV
jgi:dTDP-4-amino-4,6-dideoxygalactose transaminase